MRAVVWRKLPISKTELCLETTLRCGQSFRWAATLSSTGGLLKSRGRWRKVDDVWYCALHGRVLSLRQDSTHLHFQAAFPERALEPLKQLSPTTGLIGDGLTEDDDTEALVHHYLNLGPNLTELYEQWSSADANFKQKAPRFAGVRVLRQDSWEALVGFICSSNNNIIRISQMVSSTTMHKSNQSTDYKYV